MFFHKQVFTRQQVGAKTAPEVTQDWERGAGTEELLAVFENGDKCTVSNISYSRYQALLAAVQQGRLAAGQRASNRQVGELDGKVVCVFMKKNNDQLLCCAKHGTVGAAQTAQGHRRMDVKLVDADRLVGGQRDAVDLARRCRARHAPQVEAVQAQRARSRRQTCAEHRFRWCECTRQAPPCARI